MANDAGAGRHGWLKGLGGILGSGVVVFILGNLITGPVHDKLFGSDELGAVVSELSDTFDTARKGRQQIAVVEVEVNHCRMRPSDAAARVEGILSGNRRILSGAIDDIGDPTNHDAQRLIYDFKQALRFSKEADKDYAEWLRSWDKDFDEVRASGCNPPRNVQSYRSFLDASENASAWKEKFAELFNSVAPKQGVTVKANAGTL